MLYGAPRQAIHLATDLRSSAREAAEHERARSAVAPAAVEPRAAAPIVTRRSPLAALRRRAARPAVAHGGTR